MDRIEEMLREVLRVAREAYGYGPEDVLVALEAIIDEDNQDIDE